MKVFRFIDSLIGGALALALTLVLAAGSLIAHGLYSFKDPFWLNTIKDIFQGECKITHAINNLLEP